MIRYSAQKVKNKTAILYFIVFRLKEKLAPTVSITHYMKKQHIPTFSYIFSQDKKHEISSKSNGQTSTMSISCSRENRNETALSRVQREREFNSLSGWTTRSFFNDQISRSFGRRSKKRWCFHQHLPHPAYLLRRICILWHAVKRKLRTCRGITSKTD